jgi:predicted DNA-binding antitoxin AbrB/MazE fold protein
MSKTFAAVYENGVLRPLGAVDLPEHTQVTVILRPDPSDWLDHETMAEIDAATDEVAPTLEEVRAMLAHIPGSFADDIRAERDGQR